MRRVNFFLLGLFLFLSMVSCSNRLEPEIIYTPPVEVEVSQIEFPYRVQLETEALYIKEYKMTSLEDLEIIGPYWKLPTLEGSYHNSIVKVAGKPWSVEKR